MDILHRRLAGTGRSVSGALSHVAQGAGCPGTWSVETRVQNFEY